MIKWIVSVVVLLNGVSSFACLEKLNSLLLYKTFEEKQEIIKENEEHELHAWKALFVEFADVDFNESGGYEPPPSPLPNDPSLAPFWYNFDQHFASERRSSIYG